MVIRTIGSRMSPHRASGLAMTGRVAANRPAAHPDADQNQEDHGVHDLSLVLTLVKTGTYTPMLSPPLTPRTRRPGRRPGDTPSNSQVYGNSRVY
jgi:hypothetical protein